MEDFYDVIHGVHAASKGHIGTIKTIAEVGKLFECAPRFAIDRYVALCLVCHMWKPQTTRAPLKPIVTSGFMTRGQVKGSVEDGGLTVHHVPVQKGVSDCGSFAIAFAYHAALGDDLQTITFDQDKLSAEDPPCNLF